MKRSCVIALGVILLSACTVDRTDTSVPLGPGQIYVGYGETVYSIADYHKVSVRELIATNRLVSPYVLREGQILLLPDAAREESEKPSGPQLLTQEEEVLPRWQDPAAVAPIEPALPVQPRAQCAPELLEEVRADRGGDNLKEEPVKEAKCPPQSAHKAEPVAVNPRFKKPVSGDVLKEFGSKGDDGKKCQGVRFSVGDKTSVHASSEGTVLFSGNELGGQNIVVVQHKDGWLTAYGPLRRIAVKKGQGVMQGQDLGFTSGKTLYFEMRHNRVPVDPLKHLR